MVEQVYRTSDGQIFESVTKAVQHENELDEKKYDQRVQNFLDHSGILNTHSIDEHGVWMVRGEDPNCDYSGMHHNPYLFTARGRLVDVIKAAVKDKCFFTWGSGGEITKLEIREV